jgi:NAD(P)H-dependent flavin oxidoreductase YrpB (nitropropane dioxygenase family)
MHKNYFNSRYPILLALMNRASTMPLALACWEAGVFPSLSIPFEKIRLATDPEDRADAINQTLKEFKKNTGNCNVVLGLTHEELDDAKIMSLLLDYQVSHCELHSVKQKTKMSNTVMEKFSKNPGLYQHWYQKKLHQYSTIKFMERCREIQSRDNGVAICVRGSDAAGGTNTELTTQEMFDQQQQLTPDAVIVPYGGIGTPEQVAYYLNAGAVGVAVGTLFAACAESPLSEATKHAMISANADSLVRLPDTRQHILPLGKLTDIIDDQGQTGANRDGSLRTGIYGDGTVGHIYAGRGIQHVNSIRTVRQTVEYLIGNYEFH